VLHLFLLELLCSGKLKLLRELIKPNHLFCLLFVSDIAYETWKVDDVWGLKVLIKIMLEACIAVLGTIIMCIFVAWKVVLSWWLSEMLFLLSVHCRRTVQMLWTELCFWVKRRKQLKMWMNGEMHWSVHYRQPQMLPSRSAVAQAFKTSPWKSLMGH
jgi:hypothetical protein